ncbi:MAG: hypothetical protein QME73_06885, partial [Bacillota bacterium]|nr:hypothetical protein [Bacillota bacterium]
MFKTGKMMTILIPGLAIAFVWVLFSASMVTGQAESFPKIEEKLVAISKEEKEILQKLFGLVQEI